MQIPVVTCVKEESLSDTRPSVQHTLKICRRFFLNFFSDPGIEAEGRPFQAKRALGMPQDQITQMQFCTAVGVLNLPRARGCSRHLGKPWLPLKVLFFFF